MRRSKMGNIAKRIREGMEKAIELSKATGSECGFTWCEDGTIMPITCGETNRVVLPACKKSSNEGSFHVHTRKAPISSMDLISAIALGSKMECIGYHNGEISCITESALKKLSPEVREEIKATYKQVKDKNFDEIVRSLSKFDQLIRQKIFYNL